VQQTLGYAHPASPGGKGEDGFMRVHVDSAVPPSRLVLYLNFDILAPALCVVQELEMILLNKVYLI